MPKIRSKPLQARFQQSRWFHQTHEYRVPCWDFDAPEIAVQRKVETVLFILRHAVSSLPDHYFLETF
ncbi:hypothetical protein [Petrimonas sp.]|uniref:hypothetical protein n=1 Tax=Petrimonas sp. TaxID=2023866 RepID=UPI003F51AA88